jgi:hypothetical protein
MDPFSVATDRHRPWEPRTKALTNRCNSLVDLAHEEQLQSRRERNGQVDKATRSSASERRTVEALVLDVLSHSLSAEHELPLSIHLGTDWLRGGHKRPTAVNSGVRERLTDLEIAGWLRVTKGNNHGSGRLTTLSPGPRLIWASEQYRVTLTDIGRELEAADEVILRGSKLSAARVDRLEARERIRFEEGEATAALRKGVQRLNETFASARLDQRSTSNPPIDLSRRIVQRTFLDGRFDRGGRLGGSAFWLNLRKDRRRQDLLLDGEPIAEVDLVAALPAIAYGIEGRTMWEDPYSPDELDDVPREPLKTAFVVFLWDRYRPKTGRFPQEVYQGLPKGLTYEKIYQALCRHNQPIADYLGAESPRGAELMLHESEIIIDATFRCFAQGFVALPIHDALVVPASKAELARQALSDAFVARFKVAPMITHQTFGPEPAYA